MALVLRQGLSHALVLLPYPKVIDIGHSGTDCAGQTLAAGQVFAENTAKPNRGSSSSSSRGSKEG